MNTESKAENKAEVVDVTTTTGNAQVVRNLTRFEGRFRTGMAGRFAFLLDVGRSMGSRHSVEIGGPTLQSTPLREVVCTGRAMEVRLR